jgi:hypothetical protein
MFSKRKNTEVKLNDSYKEKNYADIYTDGQMSEPSV